MIHDLVFVEIYSLLDARDVLNCALVSREWRRCAQHSSVWRVLCRAVWNLAQATTPAGEPVGSFYDAYRAHSLAFAPYASIYSGVERSFRVIRAAAASVAPPCTDLLRPRLASSDALAALWHTMRPEHQLCVLLNGDRRAPRPLFGRCAVVRRARFFPM